MPYVLGCDSSGLRLYLMQDGHSFEKGLRQAKPVSLPIALSQTQRQGYWQMDGEAVTH